MESRPFGPIDRLKQPEYTGENRCIPCTAVNAAIAAVLAIAAALLSPPIGVAVLVLSLAAIYLRGYLVPGTPTLTKRYFPDWLLAKFDKAPEPGAAFEVTSETEAETERAGEATERADEDLVTDVDPERCLVDTGLVEPCEDVDDLCLDDEVRAAVRDRAADLRDGDRASQVAAFLDVEAAEVEIHRTDDEHVRVGASSGVVARWESDAALLADLAGTEVLAERVPEWESFSLEARSQVASGLRAFVERCPACDGPISIDGETVESCCRSYEVYAVTCDDCEARILEVSG